MTTHFTFHHALIKLNKMVLTMSAMAEDRVRKLKQGELPIFEPGLQELFARNTRAGRIMATTSAKEALAEARWVFITVGIVATVIIVRLLKHHAGQPRMALALALLLGGALGNVIDRVVLGHVVDFLYFHYRSFAWPAFNVADSAISIGAALLIWDSLRGKPAEPENAA